MRDETARLRAGLEDRGVEWEDMSIPDINVSVTLWYSEYGPCTAIEGSNDVPDGTLGVSANLTVDQAIAATLGMGVNCSKAEHDAGGCLGFQSGDDDEPVDQCKVCHKYTSYEVEL